LFSVGREGLADNRDENAFPKKVCHVGFWAHSDLAQVSAIGLARNAMITACYPPRPRENKHATFDCFSPRNSATPLARAIRHAEGLSLITSYIFDKA
jgi:hypothetical protein